MKQTTEEIEQMINQQEEYESKWGYLTENE